MTTEKRRWKDIESTTSSNSLGYLDGLVSTQDIGSMLRNLGVKQMRLCDYLGISALVFLEGG